MGIDQPKVSAMLAGPFRGYSVERLMRFRHDVEIVAEPRTHGAAELRVEMCRGPLEIGEAGTILQGCAGVRVAAMGGARTVYWGGPAGGLACGGAAGAGLPK
jgi:hypothetical protein